MCRACCSHPASSDIFGPGHHHGWRKCHPPEPPKITRLPAKLCRLPRACSSNLFLFSAKLHESSIDPPAIAQSSAEITSFCHPSSWEPSRSKCWSHQSSLYTKSAPLIDGYHRAFDTTTDAIWNARNKGVGAFYSSVVGDTRTADWDLQRQWKDIKQKYVQAPAEEGGDADDDDE